MIWTDPATGRQALWCGWSYLTKVLDMEDDASNALVDDVMGYVDRTTALYRHKWQPGDLILWNNRTLFHARTPFDESQPRTLRRTPLMDRAA
jgi:alpha-ketoglutarate-dependent taurine dioxygenase